MNKEDLLTTMAEVFGTSIDDSSTQLNIASWDSLKHIQLMMELEEKYSINIPIEIVPELTSAKALLDFVLNKDQS